MTEQITIAGEIFNAPLRYEEGHELTAGEAGALNQTYHENLRNNFAKRVKDAKDAANGSAPDMEALQAEFDKYAAEYQFGVRTGGGAVRDPVMAEALFIAKSQIKAVLKRKGIKERDVKAEAITALAKKLIDGKPEIMELARQRVAESQAAASSDLEELMADLPLNPAA